MRNKKRSREVGGVGTLGERLLLFKVMFDGSCAFWVGASVGCDYSFFRFLDLLKRNVQVGQWLGFDLDLGTLVSCFCP